MKTTTDMLAVTASGYYEVNVSLRGHHLFATNPRSITNRFQVEGLLLIFREKFPEQEGYKVAVTHYQPNCYWYETIDEFLNDEED